MNQTPDQFQADLMADTVAFPVLSAAESAECTEFGTHCSFAPGEEIFGAGSQYSTWTTQYGKSLQLCNLWRNVSPMSMCGPGPTGALSLSQTHPAFAILRSELIRIQRFHFEGIEIRGDAKWQK
jgi:hypothetical protein